MQHDEGEQSSGRTWQDLVTGAMWERKEKKPRVVLRLEQLGEWWHPSLREKASKEGEY